MLAQETKELCSNKLLIRNCFYSCCFCNKCLHTVPSNNKPRVVITTCYHTLLQLWMKCSSENIKDLQLFSCLSMTARWKSNNTVMLEWNTKKLYSSQFWFKSKLASLFAEDQCSFLLLISIISQSICRVIKLVCRKSSWHIFNKRQD